MYGEGFFEKKFDLSKNPDKVSRFDGIINFYPRPRYPKTVYTEKFTILHFITITGA